MSNIASQIIIVALAGMMTVRVVPAHADTFGSGANAFTIEFVEIGNPGNGDDFGAGGGAYSSPHGGVDYTYRIGVTEVPQDWITKATNLGMTNVTAAAPGLVNAAWTGNQPATMMSWYEAAAFVNWLNTSTGHHAAYNLSFDGSWSMTLWSSAEAWQTGGENLYRHKDAYYFLASEDEWYKAAYHKNDGVTANYWDYATGSNTVPKAVASGTVAGTAVYFPPYPVTKKSSPATVYKSGGLSPYGTRGQNGNVMEWQESAFDGANNSSSEDRAVRGGYWSYDGGKMRSSERSAERASSSESDLGFRVASRL